jgi:hypothetical protein
MMPRYFTDQEVAGLQDELIEKLDRARGYARVPFIITSGYRPPDINAAVGGVEDSEHETGEGVDLACADSRTRHRMLPALYLAGFVRIGVYDRHIHAGISKTKPQKVTWWGTSSRRENRGSS